MGVSLNHFDDGDFQTVWKEFKSKLKNKLSMNCFQQKKSLKPPENDVEWITVMNDSLRVSKQQKTFRVEEIMIFA